jgi:nitroimidazol reductase NimA-like FMN-containing flavoprotein (pyridoxamine 5'-phosphate oxidase superfamily)
LSVVEEGVRQYWLHLGYDNAALIAGVFVMRMIRSSSAWDEHRIKQFLSDTLIPIRLACIDRQGDPLVCSLWYLFAEGALWCATQQSANVTKFLQAEPRCGFEVAPDSMPYHGVRGQGRASLSSAEGPGMLLRLIDRYLGARDSEFASWLIARSATEVAIRIEADWVTSWDFSARMKS